MFKCGRTLKIFLFVCIAFSSWWLAHWLNNGVTVISTLTGSHTQNLNERKIGFGKLQNATRMVGNETEYYMSVTTHPDVQFYQSIYGAFILVILLTSLLRSFSFMKVIKRIIYSLNRQRSTVFQ
jgi:ATP-binding cassette subfamily C (CFTR/MRP) protein 5